jgi:uncharacterized protein YbaR (Trm112 family)
VNFGLHLIRRYPAKTIEPIYHRPMDTKLLDMLVCPVTKGPLRLDKTRQELISKSARLAYPIRDGIPIMLEVEARTLSDDEVEALEQAPQGNT